MKPHKHAEVIKEFVDGKDCEYFDSLTKHWEKIEDLGDFVFDIVRIKPKPDWIEERTLFWNKCINFVSYKGMGSEWLKDGKHYANLGNFRLTFDGITGDIKLVELIK
jgi:hypothetical protein